MRAATWLLVATQFAGSMPVLGAMLDAVAQTTTPSFRDRTGTSAAVSPPDSGVPAPALWSGPVEQQIGLCRLFAEPLVPSGPTTPADNAGLVRALAHFARRVRSDDCSALQDFLDTHPDSAWRASLLTEMGIFLKQRGYFSRALSAWREAWELTRAQKAGAARLVADRAVAEYARLTAAEGRDEEGEKLFVELKGREVDATVNNLLIEAREILAGLRQKSGSSISCGPFALSRIRAAQGQSPFPPELRGANSHQNGMSLVELEQLAKRVQMDYRMAKRSPGAPVVVPSVVHFKMGHFAAVTKEHNGNYLLQDPAAGTGDMWVSASALDEESSGYCLVRSGSLPAGWEAVGESEAQGVRGRTIAVLYFDPRRLKEYDEKCGGDCAHTGMPVYSMHAMLVSLNVVDTPLSYSPPYGPQIAFTITYNQRDQTQPTTAFDYPNIGKLWTFDWLSYVQDDPTGANTTVTRYLPGGGQEDYNYNPGTGTFTLQYDSRTQLTKTGSGSYKLDFPDGSKFLYNQPGSTSPGGTTRKVFLQQIVDPQGNAVSFIWSAGGRITAVQDASGGQTTLSYLSDSAVSPDYFKISQVTDRFGRTAKLTYSPAQPGADTRQLLAVTDVMNLTSQFNYQADGFMTAMTTPYGRTTFSTGGTSGDPTSRWLLATDPLGQQERVEFRQFDPTTSPIPASEPAANVPANLPLLLDNDDLNDRNSFFWSKKVMHDIGGVIDSTAYTKADIYHWQFSAPDHSACGGTLESFKKPLENRVWYRYPGQGTGLPTDACYEGNNTQPSLVARVLDGQSGQTGPTQLYQYEYVNTCGKLTKVTDPVGRITSFVYYPNDVDLKEIHQGQGPGSDLLASYTYDATYPRLVSTATDASGQTTTFSYGANAQLVSVQDAKNETTTYLYNDSTHPGFLTEIDGAITGAKVTFTADANYRVRTITDYRVRTITDSEKYTVTYDYDKFDRPTKVTYPDATTEQTIYTNLQPILVKNRQGQWTGFEYDPLGRLVAVKDSAGLLTLYSWCSCGAPESITDSQGNVTTWARDLQGRVSQKLYADGTTTSYTYENTASRLKSVTDAKGQTTQYNYNVDDTVSLVSYLNAVVPTAPVGFTYDPKYNRLQTVSDGTGTSTYTYNPITTPPQKGAGRLASISVPFSAATIAYTYDELGRAQTRSIDSTTTTVGWDALGRMKSANNALGAFTYNYDGVTPRLSSLVFPANGQETDFTYYDSTTPQNQERLQTIQNKVGANTLSRFDYQYDPLGRITSWTRQFDGGASTFYGFQYDPLSQLLGASLTNGTPASPGTLVQQFAYTYDSAGNRASASLDNPASTTTALFNNLNELTKVTPGQRTLFAGSLNKAGTVTLNGVPATVSTTSPFNFNAYVSVSTDAPIVAVIAKDINAHATTNRYQLPLSSFVTGYPTSLTYDLNGNLTSSSTPYAYLLARLYTQSDTYEWDAADRLVAINHVKAAILQENLPTRSEFSYDGFGRRVRIVERDSSGAITSEKRYVWSGLELCEERDMTDSSLNKKYFSQGVLIGNAKYFYTRDHLGSIREMVDSAGVIRARYDYDPYGNRSANQIQSGAIEADFGFTGHYVHAPSGLLLAPLRAYNPDWGRWLSRDPIGEEGGLNLYGYVANSPINFFDPLGLATYPEGFIGPIRPGDFVIRGGGNYTMRVGTDGILYPTDGGTTDLSVPYISMAIPASKVKTLFNTIMNLLNLSKKPCRSNGKKPYSTSRPSYGKDQVDQVWEDAKQEDGKVYDPHTGEELFWDKTKPRDGQWDMGHQGRTYEDLHDDYMSDRITKEEFLREYRDPKNYAPQSVNGNRSRRFD